MFALDAVAAPADGAKHAALEDTSPTDSFSRLAVQDVDAATSSSASGACTPQHAVLPPETDGQEAAAADVHNGGIEMSRRAVPAVEQDPDVCSICLDEFTQEDPSNSTQCGHMYHLQCIMQWAQRSRECPMCFKALRLQEESLNELLPFGEYRPPEQTVPSHVLLGLEAWELDRLLARLAAHGGGANGGGRSRNRAARHATRASRAAASLAEPPADAAADAATGVDGRGDAGASTPIAMQRDAAHGDGGGGGGTAYPASWPPANHSRQYSRDPSGDDHDGQHGSPAVDLRTRWAAVSSRAKESLSKTTSELRSLWGRGSSRTAA